MENSHFIDRLSANTGQAFPWFIWGALTDEIKQSVGLYYDPDAVIKRVEMERTKRLEAKGPLKKESQPSKDDDDDDDDDEEEEEEERREGRRSISGNH
jgi:hypothetical protein